ncbi:hypothetical protein LCGC14_0477940 [marine sediment metagenome]|uniref:Uncharacterized protein n=1 Tax=marine sediment metagenome TaxID=412755 RepID=A0A0F9VJ60_9ZZZZ
MNKQQLIEKYFWEQKRKEVITTVLIIVGILVLIYLIGIISLKIDPEGINIGSKEEPYNSTNVFAVGLFWFMILTVLSMVFFGFGWILYLIFEQWLETNWKKAELRVEEEMENKKK